MKLGCPENSSCIYGYQDRRLFRNIYGDFTNIYGDFTKHHSFFSRMFHNKARLATGRDIRPMDVLPDIFRFLIDKLVEVCGCLLNPNPNPNSNSVEL